MEPISVAANVTVRQAAKAMAEFNVGCVAIMDGPKLIGIFTERDILKRVLLQDLKTDETKVAEVMTSEMVTAGPDMGSKEARKLLRKHHIRHLPVVDDQNHLLGVLSIRDLVQDQVQDARQTVEEVHRYIQGGEAFEGEVRPE